MCPSALSLPIRHQLPASFPGGLRRHPRSPSHRVAAFGWDYSGGRLVDESMIVLRKRIHEMKMAETNYEAPADWMDWEKRYYATYHADVCEVLCLLQTVLMSTRPSLAIGILVAVTLSVPASAVFISVHLVEALNSLIPF